MDYGVTCLTPTEFRSKVEGWSSHDSGQSSPSPEGCPGGETTLLWAKTFPLPRTVKRRAAFSVLCIVHKFGAASKKKFRGKNNNKKEVISDMFPGLLFVFGVFSRSQCHQAKAALAAASCFPGWQGHLVGRATCAGEAGETLSLDFPPRAIFHFLSHACACLTLMFPIGLCPNLLQGIVMVMWEGDLNGVT